MWGTPTNAKDRARFAALSADDQALVRETAARLYDGTRTVARSWAEALDSRN